MLVYLFFFVLPEILQGYKAMAIPTEEDKKRHRSLYSQLEAVADLKFTYVATCQIYGNQKRSGDRRATDILNLMVKYVFCLLKLTGVAVRIFCCHHSFSTRVMTLIPDASPTVTLLSGWLTLMKLKNEKEEKYRKCIILCCSKLLIILTR